MPGMSAKAGNSIRSSRAPSLSTAARRNNGRTWNHHHNNDSAYHEPSTVNSSGLTGQPQVMPRNPSPQQQQQRTSPSRRSPASHGRNIPFHSGASAKRGGIADTSAVLPPAVFPHPQTRGTSQPQPSQQQHSAINSPRAASHTSASAPRRPSPSQRNHNSTSSPRYNANQSIDNSANRSNVYRNNGTARTAPSSAPASFQQSRERGVVYPDPHGSARPAPLPPPPQQQSSMQHSPSRRSNGATSVRNNNSNGLNTTPNRSSAQARPAPPQQQQQPLQRSGVYLESLEVIPRHARATESPSHAVAFRPSPPASSNRRRNTEGSRDRGTGTDDLEAYAMATHASQPLEPMSFAYDEGPTEQYALVRRADAPRYLPPPPQQQQQQHRPVDYYSLAPSLRLNQHRHVRRMVAGEVNRDPPPQLYQRPAPATSRAPPPPPPPQQLVRYTPIEEAQHMEDSWVSDASSTRSSRTRQVFRRPPPPPPGSMGPLPAGSPYAARPTYAVVMPRTHRVPAGLYAPVSLPAAPQQQAHGYSSPRQQQPQHAEEYWDGDADGVYDDHVNNSHHAQPRVEEPYYPQDGDEDNSRVVEYAPHPQPRHPHQRHPPPPQQQRQSPSQPRRTRAAAPPQQQANEYAERPVALRAPPVQYHYCPAPAGVPMKQVVRYYSDQEWQQQQQQQQQQQHRSPRQPAYEDVTPAEEEGSYYDDNTYSYDGEYDDVVTEPLPPKQPPQPRRRGQPSPPKRQQQQQQQQPPAPQRRTQLPRETTRKANPRCTLPPPPIKRSQQQPQEQQQSSLESDDDRRPQATRQPPPPLPRPRQQRPQPVSELPDEPSSATIAAPIAGGYTFDDRSAPHDAESEGGSRAAAEQPQQQPPRQRQRGSPPAGRRPRGTRQPAHQRQDSDSAVLNDSNDAIPVRPTRTQQAPAAHAREEDGSVVEEGQASSLQLPSPPQQQSEQQPHDGHDAESQPRASVSVSEETPHPPIAQDLNGSHDLYADSSIDPDDLLAQEEAKRLAAELVRRSLLPPTPYVAPQEMQGGVSYSEEDEEERSEEAQPQSEQQPNEAAHPADGESNEIALPPLGERRRSSYELADAVATVLTHRSSEGRPSPPSAAALEAAEELAAVAVAVLSAAGQQQHQQEQEQTPEAELPEEEEEQNNNAADTTALPFSSQEGVALAETQKPPQDAEASAVDEDADAYADADELDPQEVQQQQQEQQSNEEALQATETQERQGLMQDAAYPDTTAVATEQQEGSQLPPEEQQAPDAAADAPEAEEEDAYTEELSRDALDEEDVDVDAPATAIAGKPSEADLLSNDEPAELQAAEHTHKPEMEELEEAGEQGAGTPPASATAGGTRATAAQPPMATPPSQSSLKPYSTPSASVPPLRADAVDEAAAERAQQNDDAGDEEGDVGISPLAGGAHDGYVDPLDEAAMDAAYMLDTLEDQYVRINEETGEEMEDLVHVVELNRYDRAHGGEPRCFVPKGQFSDVLPLLRYPTNTTAAAATPTPESDAEQPPASSTDASTSAADPLTYVPLTETAYLNLCAIVWLSRFHSDEIPHLLAAAQGPSPTGDAAEENEEVCYFDHPSARLLEQLDDVIARHVRTVVETSRARAGDSFPTACVRLADRSNLAYLPPSAWQQASASNSITSMPDHVTHVLLSAMAPQEAQRRREARRRTASEAEMEAQRTWPLFLGALPWNYEEAVDAEMYAPMPTAAARLSYAFMYRARIRNLDGGLGSLIFSTLSAQIPDATVMDSLLLQEKVRLALLYSYKNVAACCSLRQKAVNARNVSAMLARESSIQRERDDSMSRDDTNGWSSPVFSPYLAMCEGVDGDMNPASQEYLLHEAEGHSRDAAGNLDTNSLGETDGGAGGDASFQDDAVDLYSIAVQLNSFFPTKTERGMHQLCAALIEDLIAMDAIMVPDEVSTPDGSVLTDRTAIVDALVVEGAQAMRHIIMTLSEQAYTSAVSTDDYVMPDGRIDHAAVRAAMASHLVLFDPAVMYFLSNPVPVDDLFTYLRCDGPPSMQPQSLGRKSAFVEVLRLQHIAETIQYAMEMQDAILVASQYNHLVAVHKKRLKQKQLQPHAHATPRSVMEEFQMDAVVVGQSVDLILHAAPLLRRDHHAASAAGNPSDASLLAELASDTAAANGAARGAAADAADTAAEQRERALEELLLGGDDADDDMSAASAAEVVVRAVLIALCCADPSKPVEEVQQYLQHLLTLYYEVHNDDNSPIDNSDPQQVALARLHAAEMTLGDWFGETASDGTLVRGTQPARCDEMRVNAEELAALCPRVLGRRVGLASPAVADAAAAISASAQALMMADDDGEEGDSVILAESAPRPPLAE